jgi:heavy metal sensor kinase
MLGPRTIRSRVAVSYVLLVTIILLLFVGFASGFFWWNLRNTLSRYAIQHIHTVEVLSLGTDGQLVVSEDFRDHFGWIRERLVEIRDFNNGEVVYRNPRLGNRSLGGAPFAGEGTDYSPRTFRLADGEHVFLISHVHDLDGRKLLIRQGYDLDSLLLRLREFIGVLLLSIPVTLLAAGIVGLRFASRILKPLENMTTMAEHITPERLDERLPVENSEDELGRLAIVINKLIARIQEDVDRLQRFTADVSHELRTPLAALRSVGEVALQRPVNKSEYADAIGSMLEEANRLTRLVDSLLMLSRMDSGHVDLNLAACNVFEVLQQCVTLLDILAQEEGQLLIFGSSGNGLIAADEVLLRYAFVNIIHNAIKFTPAGGTIVVDARRVSSMGVEITVDDEGPGIPEESRKKVFERFYHSSPGQTGAGLGLAIAKWIVEAHHGTISVSARASGGSQFTIQLPHCLGDASSQVLSATRNTEVSVTAIAKHEVG